MNKLNEEDLEKVTGGYAPDEQSGYYDDQDGYYGDQDGGGYDDREYIPIEDLERLFW